MDEHASCVEVALKLYQRKLVALAYSILRSLDEAKDEAQNAFIKLSQKNCPSIENREAWLVTVCRNSALKALRRHKRVESMSLAKWENLPDESEPVGSDIERAQAITNLLSTIDGLPPTQREVMRLKYVSGMTSAQIATVLKTNANNVYQLHFTALEAVRKQTSGHTDIAAK